MRGSKGHVSIAFYSQNLEAQLQNLWVGGVGMSDNSVAILVQVSQAVRHYRIETCYQAFLDVIGALGMAASLARRVLVSHHSFASPL